MDQFIAIKHQGAPESWYFAPGLDPIEEDVDQYIEGDHDLHAIIPVNTSEEIEVAEKWTGHQWIAVRRMGMEARDIYKNENLGVE